MNYICKICNKSTFINRPDDKPLPENEQICYSCEKKKRRKEIKTKLGYSRIGLNNI